MVGPAASAALSCGFRVRYAGRAVPHHDPRGVATRSGDRRLPTGVAEGFIHLSTDAQWRRTRERFFADQTDLVLLVIDPDRVTDVRWESADSESFPHLYSALTISAVVEVREL
jgi:uncharacterized protein (DUF952 family)